MIKVLHLGHSRKWRGGENQVKLLIQRMQASHPEIEHHIAYPHKSLMIESIGSQVEGIVELPSSRPFDPRSVIAVSKYCQHHSIKVLHAHSGNAHSLAYYVKQFICEIHIVVHRHVNFPIKSQFLTRKKYLSDKIDHYVAISSKIQQRLVEYGIPNKKISLIKSCIDTNLYKNRGKLIAKENLCGDYNLDLNQPLLGFAGALEADKNPLLFVKIIAELKQSGQTVNAVMAGKGRLKNKIENEINKLKLGENIKMIGFIQSMPEFFSALDIFVLCSQNEGLGTVLLEAASTDCVIVASDVGGVGEIIRHEHTGMLADKNCAFSFVTAIEKLITHDEFSNQIKKNAKAHTSKKFNLQYMIDQNFLLYNKVAS